MDTIDYSKINLRDDIIFKYVFASENSEEILLSLLNAIFQDSRQEVLTGITYLNPFNIKEKYEDKSTILDIKATDTKGRQYNIEMQVRKEPQFIERIIYYNSRLFSSQLKQGQTYKDLMKTISVAITDYTLFGDEKPVHNIFRLLNVKSHRELADIVEYHFIELPKYKDNENIKETMNKWLFAMKNSERYIHDPDKLPDSIKKEAMIMRAIQKMKKAAADPELRAIMEYREKAELDELNRLYDAERRGVLLGEKRGIELGEKTGDRKAREAIALTMLSMNMKIEEVAKATGLSITIIKNLKK